MRYSISFADVCKFIQQGNLTIVELTGLVSVLGHRESQLFQKLEDFQVYNILVLPSV